MFPKEGHPFGSEEDLFEAFMVIKAMVEELYRNRKKVEESVLSGTTTKIEQEGSGGDPREIPSSSSSSSYSSSSSSGTSSLKKHPKKTPFDFPLLKIDCKFDFLMYDGEIHAKKLDK